MLRATIASAGIGGLNAGPYDSGFNVPLTASMASRRISASSRSGRRRHSRRLSGSIFAFAGSKAAPC